MQYLVEFYKGRIMEDRSLLMFIVGFIVFFFGLFISLGYSESVTNDCKIKGLQAGRPAIEIQAVCGRR
jgi:hypothetical protein